MDQNSVITGAMAYVRCNGIRIGYATDLSLNIAANAIQIKVLGSGITQQIPYTGFDVAFTVNTFRLFDNSAMTQGLFPRGDTDSLLNFPYVDFDVVARVGGEVIFRIMKCKPTSMQMGVAQSGALGQNLSFTGTTFSDETNMQVETVAVA